MLTFICLLPLVTLVSSHVLPDFPDLDVNLPDFNLPDLDGLEFGAKVVAYGCRSGDQCSTCPDSVRRLSWTSVSIMGSVLFNTTKTQCAKDCHENIECRDHLLGRHCACVPHNMCLRGRACADCEEEAVTTVLGQRFCCEGCRKSTVSIQVDPPHVLVPTCVCNSP